ncbi:MAG: glycoside hydrolase family 92 protein, partial [Lutibacter sp.]
MKNNTFKFLFVLLCITIVSCNTNKSNEGKTNILKTNLVDYVNPLMGTDSEYILSNGNTYPAIAAPWGMNFWTPMTSKMGDGWTYKYDEYKIRGI